MNTPTAASPRIDIASTLRRKAQAFWAELYRALDFMGRAYGHGVPPL